MDSRMVHGGGTESAERALKKNLCILGSSVVASG
jgi:hypothetical protein